LLQILQLIKKITTMMSRYKSCSHFSFHFSPCTSSTLPNFFSIIKLLFPPD
jgi:hypothetical protein